MPVYTLVITRADGTQATTLSDFRDDRTAIAEVGIFVSDEHPSAALARDAGDDAEFLGAWDFEDGQPRWTTES